MGSLCISNIQSLKRGALSMPVSHTPRTLKLYRELGYLATVTERWNPYAKIRQDLFGFIDILAINDTTCVGIQSTSRGNHLARREKILSLPAARAWVKMQGRLIHLISWDMDEDAEDKRGVTRSMWVPRIEVITLEDFG